MKTFPVHELRTSTFILEEPSVIQLVCPVEDTHCVWWLSPELLLCPRLPWSDIHKNNGSENVFIFQLTFTLTILRSPPFIEFFHHSLRCLFALL